MVFFYEVISKRNKNSAVIFFISLLNSCLKVKQVVSKLFINFSCCHVKGKYR